MPVPFEQAEVLRDARAHRLDEFARHLLEAGRDVLDHAADLEVTRVEALAARHLEQVQCEVAVTAAPPEHRDRPDVERAGGDPEQMRGDPVQLEMDHPEPLSALRHLLVEQLLDRHAERHRVEVVREVVHALDERNDLPVLLVLAALLDSGVDVADDRLHVAHDLALERREQPQHSVRCRVVRADVDGEELVMLLAHRLHRHRALALAVRNAERLGHCPGPAEVSHTSAGASAR
jgi:hypothetical protein